MENIKNVLEYYENYNENTRLLERCEIEYIRTKDIISRYLPKNPVKILDMCGASGHYAYWLAELGHEVHLMDLSPKHIKEAKQNQKLYKIKLKTIKIGDARKVRYKNESFDIVLLMGALYHLQSKDDRILCLNEVNRILRKGGTAVFAYISRFAAFIDMFKSDKITESLTQKNIEKVLYTGKVNSPEKAPKGFTTAYLHSITEIKEELFQTNFNDVIVYGVEGFSRLIDKENYLNNPKKLETLLYNIRLIEQDPEVIGLSDHKLAVCKKLETRKNII
jgi:ubiquinone/menaquinone biosynthesis C-methylase UbiE